MPKVAFLSTVKAKLFMLIGLFVLTVVVLGIYSLTVLNSVKVGGPLYQRITQTMNIRADILPPPQYLIETELTAFQLADETFSGSSDAVLSTYEKKLKQLKKDFEDGQQGWDAQLPSDTQRARTIRVVLLEKNNKVCSDYFSLLFGEFITAIRAHDQKQVNSLLHGQMKQLADKHRKIIDDLTALTDESSREDEAFANAYVHERISLAVFFVTGMLSIAIVFASMTMRSITRPVSEAIATVKSLESGNLNARVEKCGQDELGKMCESLNAAISAVRDMVQKAVESSVNLDKYSRSLSAVASAVTTGVHRQASNLEETSAQLGEVATLSQSIAAGGHEGQQAAQHSREVADNGIQVVQTAIAGMTAIGKAAAEINQIVDAVDEISFNTNLLAVNASVEAAVAGEQGRGFRVVAEEIKTLSVRTDAAGKKIRKLIQDTNEAILQGSERVEASGKAFEDIVICIRRLKAIMDEVASASTTQADSLDQLKQAVLAISEVVDKNSIGTDTINATSRDLAKEAKNMHGLVSAFKL